jgi:hypothetical protein
MQRMSMCAVVVMPVLRCRQADVCDASLPGTKEIAFSVLGSKSRVVVVCGDHYSARACTHAPTHSPCGSIDILARRRDDLNDEIAHLKREKRNTAYQTSLIEELDDKHNALVSTCLMLKYDANSFRLPRSSPVRLFLVRLADRPEFRGFVFAMILCNCAILALDSPPRVGRERFIIDLIQVLGPRLLLLLLLISLIAHPHFCRSRRQAPEIGSH